MDPNQEIHSKLDCKNNVLSEQDIENAASSYKGLVLKLDQYRKDKFLKGIARVMEGKDKSNSSGRMEYILNEACVSYFSTLTREQAKSFFGDYMKRVNSGVIEIEEFEKNLNSAASSDPLTKLIFYTSFVPYVVENHYGEMAQPERQKTLIEKLQEMEKERKEKPTSTQARPSAIYASAKN